MKKIKDFVKKHYFVLTTGMIMLTSSNACQAEDLAVTFETALTGVKTDVLAMVGKAAVPALAIGGLFLAWRKGWAFFKSIAK